MAGKRMEILGTVSFMVMIALMLLLCALLLGGCTPGGRAKPKAVRFTESAKELHNPNRGFYYIHDFWIRDEEMDFEQLMSEKFAVDADTELALIQICLQDYREGDITEQGLANVEALFAALESMDKQLIVRFVYDREGKGMEYEPERLEIILGHMRQLEPVLRAHSSRIFILQGLFTGSWGEMNGTRYTADGDLRSLAAQLANVTEETTYLAVRTPRQRRIIVESQKSLAQRMPEYDSLGERLGLFNDGMLGNESDYGTYGTEVHKGDFDLAKAWRREDELDYQKQLCCRVPNGGEVITVNPYNDFDNAVRDLAAMRITYLNREYDGQVLAKWENTIVKEDGCYDGMDGLSYIERHLGYRLLITDVEFTGGNFWESRMTANITLRNVGFAPLYREMSAKVILYNEESGRTLSYPVEQSPQELVESSASEEPMELSAQIDLKQVPFEKYTVYLDLTDTATGERILLANEQEEEPLGYRIGVREW